MNMLATALLSLVQAPGDFQSWIDSAAPESVLRVPAGSWNPIVIDKPLTLIGDDGAVFEGRAAFPPVIELAGQGTGKVTLANIDVRGSIQGCLADAMAGGITGGGFETLEVFECDIAAPEYLCVADSGSVGGPGISVTTGHVLVVQSTVRASWGRGPFCEQGRGAAGIEAPSSLVEIYDSTVAGSSFIDPCFDSSSVPPSCPDSSMMAQAAGPGVRADVLRGEGNVVAGGAPTSWRSFTQTGVNSWEGEWADCGAGPGGGEILAPRVFSFASDLDLTGSPTLGGTLTLSWTVPRPLSALYVQVGSDATRGKWCLTSRAIQLVLSGPTGTIQGRLPLRIGILGATLAFQVYGFNHYQSRPQFVVIR